MKQSKFLNCIITTSKNTIKYENIISVALPAFDGQMQILPGHSEAFILLNKGNIILHKYNNEKEVVEIIDGECYTKGNKVIIVL